MLKWYFPATGGGATQGFNDSAQEHFKDNAWEHTIREIIQNSLDAADNRRNKPVKVNIEKIKIPTSEIGGKVLADHINEALKLTREQENKKGIAFYENALNILKQNEINTLAITDTNTTGLVDKKWDSLIYVEGTTYKGDTSAAGGSFGIGKSAPYLISELKTVCYSTRYLNKNDRHEKFIARCKISSHKNPKSSSNEMLQHIGFGSKSEFKKDIHPYPPSTNGSNIYQIFRLNNIGSGIFIVGFNPAYDWIEIAKKSIARNFFVAIHEKKLEVTINSDLINYDTLNNIFESDKEKEPTRHYYHIIRNDCPKKIVEGKFGKFTVQINTNAKYLPNQIAYINKRGMLITDKRTFKDNPFHTSIGNGWAKYAAVIMAHNDATDEKIREMEPPNHRSIKYERIEEKERKSIKEQLRVIRNKIAEIINDAVSINNGKDDINLSDLADVLPDTDDGLFDSTGSDRNDLKDGDLESNELKPKLLPTGGKVQTDDTEPGGNSNGGNPGPSKPPRKPSEQNSGTPILDQRRIMRNKNELRVAFTPHQNKGKSICFGIRPVGEERKNEKLIPITLTRTMSATNPDINIQDNCITMTPKNDKRIVIDLEIHQVQSYTGYEIVEFITNKKSTGRKKK